MATNDVAFYNALYLEHPGKWAQMGRDPLAYAILSEYIEHPARVLDFGCGSGHTMEFLKAHWPESHYTGVDISDVALRLAGWTNPGFELYQDLPEGTWNLILIMGVVEHFPLPMHGLKMLGERLEGEGLLYLEVPDCMAYSVEPGEGFRLTHDGSGQSEWHLERQSWEKIIRGAGLRIVEYQYIKGDIPQFIWVLRRKHA